jgi:alkylation response protein AidB-like acyl-CoA dehydrogenase
VPAVLLGVEGAGGRLMGRSLDLASVSLAEEQVNGIRRCLQLSAAAARTADTPEADARRLCGELRLDLEVAEAMCGYAGRVAASDAATEGSIAAAMAHICCSEAFTKVARATVQLVAETGGETSDEAARLFLRAQSSDLLFGGPALYYERLLERMGI